MLTAGMAKLRFHGSPLSAPCRAPPVAGLIVAATLACLNASDGAEARGADAGRVPPDARRIVHAGHPGGALSFVLPAAQTWSVHRPAARRAFAFLTIRCGPDATPGVFVAFPDRVWHGETAVHYRLGGGRPRRAQPSPERPARGALRLGGSELVRDMARADVLEVLIDDLGLGSSEAVFALPRAEAAVQQIAESCRPGRPAAVAAVSTPPPAPERRRSAAVEERGRPPVLEEVRQPVAEIPDPAPSPRPTEPVGEARPADEPEQAAAPDAGLPAASPPEPTPPPPEIPAPLATADAETAPPSPAQAEPSPPPEPPRAGDPSGRSDRVAAFVQRYGPNRQGELIYGWYRQCLDRAGIDREQVWYLSDETLTYLARGETDQVRLSMLVSTSRDLGDPPRRVICNGTARGRELTIESAQADG
jgi:hypothetical protein